MSITAGQLEVLAQELHKISADAEVIKNRQAEIRHQIMQLMRQDSIRSFRTIWGLLTLKDGRKSKVYKSEKIIKWEAKISAEKALLDKLGQVEIIIGDESLAFSPSK